MALEKIKALLANDRLAYTSHLKMIEDYGDAIDCRLTENAAGWAAALLLPVSVSSFDSQMYPGASHVVYLAGEEAKAIRGLLSEISDKHDLVFKLQSPLHIQLAQERFPLCWKRAFLNYTSPAGAEYARSAEVARQDRMDVRLDPLWEKNGYSTDDIVKYFSRGAISFSVFREGEPLSTCMIFHNCCDIWEIGAVHTVDAERGRGYARLVVASALEEILRTGNIPKYQVAHSNTPSIRLAESLGLREYMQLGHYYYSAGQSCPAHAENMI